MVRRLRLRLLAFCAAAACSKFALAHHTEPANWLNRAGGPFADPSNWSVNIIPAQHDSVYFDLANPVYTINFSESVMNVQATIGGNDVTFDLGGSSYTVYDLAGFDIQHAVPNAATLRIIHGSVTSLVGASIAKSFTTAGNLYIDGSDASFIVANDLQIAGHGNAYIQITNGATLSDATASMSTLSSSTSKVLISGDGSRWDNAQLNVGSTFNRPAEVRVSGGTLSASSFIKLWRNGKIIYEGGNIETPQVQMAGGMLSAFGTFSTNIINGGGSLDVPSGQVLTLSGSLSTPYGDTLVKTGPGQLIIDGPQDHSAFSVLRSGAGKLILSSNAGTPATATAPAVANLSLSVDPVTAAITLNADQDLANLTVNEAWDGQQAFDLASPADAGGFRSVRIADVNTKTDVWASIANANRAGAANPNDGIFDSGLINHPSSAIGLGTHTNAHGDPFLLVRPTRVGDLNLDGVVTISDFIDLAANFGSTSATWQEGDLNYDNEVSISDFIDAAANFGASYAADSAVGTASAVPEPFAVTLLLLPLGLGRRRRK